MHPKICIPSPHLIRRVHSRLQSRHSTHAVAHQEHWLAHNLSREITQLKRVFAEHSERRAGFVKVPKSSSYQHAYSVFAIEKRTPRSDGKSRR